MACSDLGGNEAASFKLQAASYKREGIASACSLKLGVCAALVPRRLGKQLNHHHPQHNQRQEHQEHLREVLEVILEQLHL